MAFRLGDRARETSTAPGLGSFTVNGAVQGAQSLASVLTSNADTSWYFATNGTAWEVGLLTRTSATVFARATPFASSNGGALVNFSTGLVDIALDLPAWVLDHLNLVEAALASAATADLGSILSKCVQLTGTTGITSFGTGKNKERLVRYTGAGLTITTGSTLVCPGAVNLTLVTDDIFLAVSDNTSTPIWRIMWVRRASGSLVPSNASASNFAASGALSVGAHLNTASPNNTFSMSPSTNAQISDTSNGYIFFCTEAQSFGTTAIYMTVNSSVVLVYGSGNWVSPTTTPAASKQCVASNGSTFSIYNGATSTVTINIASIRIR